MIKNNQIELIITDIDLKSHKKYFNVMQKYRDYAIITIDDDIIYTRDLIETLFTSYLKYPNCIHARYVNKIMINKNSRPLPFIKWIKNYTFELRPSFYLFGLSRGGILYPPNILNVSSENLKDINKCIKADDIYLKYLSRKRNVRIVWVVNNFSLGLKEIKNNKIDKYRLYNNIKVDKINDNCLDIFPII